MQASVQSGSIRLTDNGARLADRLAALHRDIQKQEQLIKCAKPRNLAAVHTSRPSQGDTDHMVNSKQVQADGPNSEPAAAAADKMQKGGSTMRESIGRQSNHGLVPGASSGEAQSQPNHSVSRRSDRASSQAEQQTQRTQRGSQASQQSERPKTADQQGGRAGAQSIRGRGTARGRGRQSSDLNRYTHGLCIGCNCKFFLCPSAEADHREVLTSASEELSVMVRLR